MKKLLAIFLLAVSGVQAAAAVEIQDVTSPGGIKAWLVEEHSIPFVSLELRFKGGGNLDLDGKRGATNLMTGLLEEGTGDLDSRAFAKARDSLAASFGFDVGADTVSVSARFLTETQDQAMDLLHQALVAPNFDEASLERVRQQVLTGIRSSQTDPNDIAGREFALQVYGDHPYATPYEGTAESVTALTRDDIVTAHKNALALDRVYVSAVGDITAEQLGTLLDKLLAGLPETGAPAPGPATLTFDGKTTVKPFETPQSVALFAQPGMERDDPDYFAAYILNQILGGSGFDSRLMTEVREKRGLTYGIGTYLIPRDYAELWMGQVASANDKVADAISVVRDEWSKLAKDGVTQEELDQAKTYLTGAYPLRFDSNAAIADILVGMQMDDLPISYVETRNDNVNAVTLEQINRVAAELLKPDELTFMVVGQPAGL
ncbi:insulinase family protein [Donghicola sp. C2-DW-16]|uniref:Insulinase family protein n=1 Tax=Donghicola mangrovi TaxID=2729614 RepID=A0ABX2PAD2_9RHOB|nr:pitrilysin family protein [Donghicola mangrovi]NVO25817.1 insulinase family protein [Donghicola mangrovi]